MSDDSSDARTGPSAARPLSLRRRSRNVRIMLFVLIPVVVIAVLVAGLSVMTRRAEVKPSEWHIDPTTAPPTGNPNWYRVTPDSAPADRDAERDGSAPIFTADVAALAAAFDAVALADARVEVIAGSAADGFVTYMQRSALFGFPDFISVKFVEVSNGSSLAIFSRARDGKSDLDVNNKRVTRWLDATAARLN
ncbi:MAG: DUF1499 domain-containing protein [Ilumatobacter sp.]